MMSKFTKEEVKQIRKEIEQMEEVDERERQRQEEIERLRNRIYEMANGYREMVEELLGEDKAKAAISSYKKGAFDVLKLLGYE